MDSSDENEFLKRESGGWDASMENPNTNFSDADLSSLIEIVPSETFPSPLSSPLQAQPSPCMSPPTSPITPQQPRPYVSHPALNAADFLVHPRDYASSNPPNFATGLSRLKRMASCELASTSAKRPKVREERS